jgi:hypothetical protein
MLIREQALQHWIDNYYGYGSWNAGLWFISLEEGGGDTPEEVAAKVNYFERAHPDASRPTLCDLREAYKSVPFTDDGPKADLFTTLYDYRFGSAAIPNNIWKNLSLFVHAFKGEVPPDPLSYQQTRFALSEGGREALIKLYPLPSPHNHAWYYSWLDLPRLRFLKSRSLYQKHLFKTRLDNILRAIELHKPELVLMYGMENIIVLKESIEQFFPGAKFQMIKAVKQTIPQHHRAYVHGTLILVTTQIPTLRHNRVESGFEWHAFGKLIKDQR